MHTANYKYFIASQGCLGLGLLVVACGGEPAGRDNRRVSERIVDSEAANLALDGPLNLLVRVKLPNGGSWQAYEPRAGQILQIETGMVPNPPVTRVLHDRELSTVEMFRALQPGQPLPEKLAAAEARWQSAAAFTPRRGGDVIPKSYATKSAVVQATVSDGGVGSGVGPAAPKPTVPDASGTIAAKDGGPAEVASGRAGGGGHGVAPADALPSACPANWFAQNFCASNFNGGTYNWCLLNNYNRAWAQTGCYDPGFNPPFTCSGPNSSSNAWVCGDTDAADVLLSSERFGEIPYTVNWGRWAHFWAGEQPDWCNCGMLDSGVRWDLYPRIGSRAHFSGDFVDNGDNWPWD
jgi:hypothetical protein